MTYKEVEKIRGTPKFIDEINNANQYFQKNEARALLDSKLISELKKTYNEDLVSCRKKHYWYFITFSELIIYSNLKI